jgi:hypothetical protein
LQLQASEYFSIELDKLKPDDVRDPLTFISMLQTSGSRPKKPILLQSLVIGQSNGRRLIMFTTLNVITTSSA